jgi:hypothetical protein
MAQYLMDISTNMNILGHHALWQSDKIPLSLFTVDV